MSSMYNLFEIDLVGTFKGDMVSKRFYRRVQCQRKRKQIVTIQDRFPGTLNPTGRVISIWLGERPANRVFLEGGWSMATTKAYLGSWVETGACPIPRMLSQKAEIGWSLNVIQP